MPNKKPADKPAPDAVSADAPAEPAKPAQAGVAPAMTETQIRDSGLAVDVPFESGQPKPDRLRYADLGKTWTPPDGWPPEEGAATTEQGDE